MKNIVFIMILILMCACGTQKEIIEVPIETVKTEYIHDIRIDSIVVRDSVDRYMQGDTLVIYKEHTKYKYRNRTDTVVKVDSIPVIIKVNTIKEVEVNHIKWYQNLLMWIGGLASFILIGCIIYKIKIRQ